jgi:hypothetical protein
MVEFGLKLEDNKNAEWSEKYIDYERLKKLLKNAKKAADAREELAKRHPGRANEIQSSFERDRQAVASSSLPRTNSASTISTVANHLSVLDESSDVADDSLLTRTTSPFGFEISNHGDEMIPLTRNNTDNTPKTKPSTSIIEGTQLLDAAAETSSLLLTTMTDVDIPNYGSHPSLNMSDSVSNFSALLRGAKGVFDNYESKFKYALEAEYSAMEKFSIEMYREVREV